jgi:hypothetical protein
MTHSGVQLQTVERLVDSTTMIFYPLFTLKVCLVRKATIWPFGSFITIISEGEVNF